MCTFHKGVGTIKVQGAQGEEVVCVGCLAEGEPEQVGATAPKPKEELQRLAELYCRQLD